MTRRELTTAERVFLRGYNPIFERLLGWRQDRINAEFVRTYGVSGLMRFGKSIGGGIALFSERWGEATAHHIVGFAGMMNGCRWCGVGHNLVGNLLVFEQRGQLYPIDELEIPSLQGRSDEQILETLRERLEGSEWDSNLPLFERLQELRNGADEDGSDQDYYLQTALRLWAWTNECTIETGLEIDAESVPVLSKLNKRRALYERYREEREQG